MKFQVWIACKVDCENFEAPHKLLLVDDALSAIVHANSYRDRDHETWIETIG